MSEKQDALIMALLESEANRILSSVEEVAGVAITLIGPRSLPLGLLLLKTEHKNAGAVLTAIRRLSDQIDGLAQNLVPEKENYEGDHSESLVGKRAVQAYADADKAPADEASHSAGEASAEQAD